jgi:N-acetylmuramoyl-L-alanine amidase
VDRNGVSYAISHLVLHGTAGGGTVPWFQSPDSEVSAHYVVDEDGSVTQMVKEHDTAWHAGAVPHGSFYYGKPNPNLWSIGIEFVRNNANDDAMPSVQIESGLNLVRDIFSRRGVLGVLTHDQIQPGRVCPGPGFPTDRFTDVDRGLPTMPVPTEST